ncbi:MULTISPECIES: copper resistance protein B [Brevundimonas]|jgi:copper resistance protein B|uniref:Copper resistance protein B n=2 Tax=Brevundimonas TaxID=41275 RepID=A0A2X1D3T6_BREVE|nr:MULTISPECIES: copper resistance protein B [Brevundimonas]MBB5772573.1 copper resistance protein B [Brevundimonas vesicularis]SPU55195.1 Copper resistance protein B precursor [Brevundimonas vesicularis]
MIRRSVGLVPLLLAASAGPVFAQSHAGHGAAANAVQTAVQLPAGCVRRGAPTADPSRVGTPGAPVCPTGAVPERAPASADPHAGHDMSTMSQTAPAPAMPAGHDMSTMQSGQQPAAAGQPDPHAGHDMSTMRQTAPAPATPAGHDMSTMQSGQRPAAAGQPDPHAGHDMSTMGQTAPAPAMPAGHDMSTMQSGQQPAAAAQPDPHAGHDMSTMRQTAPASAMPAGHDMSTMGQMPPGHDMSAMAMPPDVPTSADNPGRPPEMPLPPGATSGPAHAADTLFDPAEMAAAREQLRVENGDVRTTAVIIDQLEASFGDGEEGYALDAQGWTGGDINRFWWKSEVEGDFDGEVEEAEVQALYSRAFRPFFDFQTGLRQTYRPEGDRTDLVVGIQGLAPYWFEVDAAAFLSNKGELTARAEAEYDQRITNRWIVQPRAEVVLSAEDIPELRIGSGLSTLQIGARLRYEFRKEFAPYVGVEWTKSFGNTADFLEADGRSSEDTRLVVGIRAWF